MITLTLDESTLYFPAEISAVIGMSAPEINALKAKGCRFLNKKTCIKWVRAWIDAHATPTPEGSLAPATFAHA